MVPVEGQFLVEGMLQLPPPPEVSPLRAAALQSVWQRRPESGTEDPPKKGSLHTIWQLV